MQQKIKELHREDNKLKFNAPIPITSFRAEAKRHLSAILISIKAKNKVMTQNVNKIKTKQGVIKKDSTYTTWSTS